MSHYTVLVTGRETEDIAYFLAPYQENNMGDCPKEFLSWIDQTEEIKAFYEQDFTKMVEGPDGTLYSEYDPKFMKPIPGKPNMREQVYPDDHKFVDVPSSEVCTMAEFAQEEFGASYNPAKRSYGHYENPNAKWDYYQVGGRWTGLLRVKEEFALTRRDGSLPYGEQIANGNPGLFGSPTQDPYFCDTCMVKHLDIEWHKQYEMRLAAKRWDAWHSPKRIKFNSEEEWHKLSEDQKNEVIEYQKENDLFFLEEDDVVAVETSTRDEYLELNGAPNPFTYAFIDKDRNWHARAEMAMFGMSHSHRYDYASEFWAFLDGLDGQDRIWVIDVHI